MMWHHASCAMVKRKASFSLYRAYLFLTTAYLQARSELCSLKADHWIRMASIESQPPTNTLPLSLCDYGAKDRFPLRHAHRHETCSISRFLATVRRGYFSVSPESHVGHKVGTRTSIRRVDSFVLRSRSRKRGLNATSPTSRCPSQVQAPDPNSDPTHQSRQAVMAVGVRICG